MLEAKVGDSATAEITLRDALGQVTEIYDQAAGVRYVLSHPDSMAVVDEDSNPLDCRVDFVAPTPDGEVATITVELDGDPDAGAERLLTLQSEEITVVMPPPGAAVTGDLKLTFHEVAV